MKQTTKKSVFLSLMAVATLTLLVGTMTPAQAQWGNNRGRGNDRYDDRGRNSRNQQDCDVFGNPRDGRYGNDNRRNRGGYDDYGYGNGNYGRNGGFRNEEQEKGYRDGLRRGQEDLQSNRIPDPNNSSHYRKGNADYREGFRRGYQDGYPSRGRSNRRW